MAQFENSRRDFMKKTLAAAVALPLLKTAGSVTGFIGTAEAKDAKSGKAKAAAPAKKDVPLPAGQQAVSESDPLAQALGYKHSVKDVDMKKYPNRAKKENQNQFCSNCALYTQVNEGWGKCQMIQNGLVNANGWCGSWNKRA